MSDDSGIPTEEELDDTLNELTLTVTWSPNGFHFDVPPFPAVVLAGIAWELDQMALEIHYMERQQHQQNREQTQKRGLLVPLDHQRKRRN